MKEEAYYSEINEWLKRQLRSHYSDAKIQTTYETSKRKLSEYIFAQGLAEMIPDYDIFEFKSDVTGFIIRPSGCSLVLVECKPQINLTSIAQIVGYAKVAKSQHAFLISVADFLTPAVSKLLLERRRYDLLEYSEGKMVRVARWDHSKRDISYDVIIPSGDFWS